MKQLYVLGGLLAAFFLMLSFSSGPGSAGRAVTGAPGEPTCAMCHAGNAFNQTTTIEVKDNSGNLVTGYMPNTNYKVSVNINAGNGNPSGYGFQMTSLVGNSADTDRWGALPNGVNKVTVSGGTYVEHNSTSDNNVFVLDWTSPDANSGTVDFYATGNAVNRNGGTSGDDPNATSLSLPEATTGGGGDLPDCMPDPQFANLPPSIFPLPSEGGNGDAAVGISEDAFIGQPYFYSFTVSLPEAFTSDIASGSADSLIVKPEAFYYLLEGDTFPGLPEGLEYKFSNPGLTYYSAPDGLAGCVTLEGTPSENVVPGDYLLHFVADICVNIGFPICLEITIPNTDGVVPLPGVYRLTINAPAPVELVSFDGECENGSHHLSWTTATEIDNDYFSIESSINGEDWAEISTIEGKGNTSQFSNYEVNVDAIQSNYYRLVQYDYDGFQTYSDVIKVNDCNRSGLDYAIYPNPASDKITFESDNEQGNISIDIIDMMGKVVMTQDRQSDLFDIDISQLNAGVYLISMRINDQIVTSKRIIKQ